LIPLWGSFRALGVEGAPNEGSSLRSKRLISEIAENIYFRGRFLDRALWPFEIETESIRLGTYLLLGGCPVVSLSISYMSWSRISLSLFIRTLASAMSCSSISLFSCDIFIISLFLLVYGISISDEKLYTNFERFFNKSSF
jgi:hypothetical protein